MLRDPLASCQKVNPAREQFLPVKGETDRSCQHGAIRAFDHRGCPSLEPATVRPICTAECTPTVSLRLWAACLIYEGLNSQSGPHRSMPPSARVARSGSLPIAIMRSLHQRKEADLCKKSASMAVRSVGGSLLARANLFGCAYLGTGRQTCQNLFSK